jgi:hypothetical protein
MEQLITENWDAWDFQVGISAHRELVGTGFTSESQFRQRLPKPGSPHPGDRRLTAEVPRIATPRSPLVMVASLDYSPAAGSGGGEGSGLEKLKEPPRYKLVIGEASETYDRDIWGNPLTNSAIQPFKTKFTDKVTTIFYVYTRWEPNYNGPQAIAYANKINSDRVELPGFGWIEPDQGLIAPPEMLDEINRYDEATQVRYTIELREDGFRARFLDQGTEGWSTSGGTRVQGPFFTLGGEQVSTDVLLDGKGKPIHPERYKIGQDALAPEASANFPPKHVTVEKTDLAYYLRYDVKKSRPFRALDLKP